MKKYERFQQVITYYLKSINAYSDFLKLKVNEGAGKKKKNLEDKLSQVESKKSRVMGKLNKILTEESEVIRKIEQDLELINEDIKTFVHEYNASQK